MILQRTDGSLTRPSDTALIDLWLHDRPLNTQRSYERVAREFLAYVGKPLDQVTLADLQAFARTLDELAPASRGTYLAGVKALFSFAAEARLIPVNVGAALRVRGRRDRRSERILSEEEVKAMLVAAGESERDYLLVLLLYTGGLRVGEAVGLHWSDLQRRARGGQVSVFGKGDKTRTIMLPTVTWEALREARRQRNEREDSAAYVFPSPRPAGHMSEDTARDIVGRVAAAAGIAKAVSPHWLRHACFSHALDNGAPLHVVQATAGHSSLAVTGAYLHARPDQSAGLWLNV